MKAVLNIFYKNKTLVRLNLYRCDIGREGISLIEEFLKGNRTFGAFRLPFCKTGMGKAKVFDYDLLMSDGDVELLASALMKNRKLALLDLRYKSFSSIKASALRNAICNGQALTSLDMEYGSTPESREAMADIKAFLLRNIKAKLFGAPAAYIDLCLRHSPCRRNIIRMPEINEEIAKQISLIDSETSFAMVNQVLEIPLSRV